MKRPLLLALVATGFIGASAEAQTLTLISPTVNDGSFESSAAAKNFFTTTNSATVSAAVPVPYWASTGTGPTNDSGTQSGANLNVNGNFGAFEQPGGSIFNLVTSRPIAVGDTYTLTFYGKDTQNSVSGTLLASFFYQTPPTGTTYSYAAQGALGTPQTFTLQGNTANPSGALTQYTLSYTVTAADAAAGNDIGIALTDTSTDYNGLDNFVLTVTPAAVPEPGTYAMLAVGGLGATLVLRRRRA